MSDFDVFMHVDLLHQVPKTGVNRKRIMQFIDSLRATPYVLVDFTDRDSSRRDRQVKIIGDYAVTYWVDVPVKAVMIVDVRTADA